VEKLSNMMRQYVEIKEQNKDCILFFRLGDFYEMFFEDAKIASAELDLTLTGRACGLEEKAPMCGVPYHSYEGYVAKLIKKGYKVAICEQVEDPKTTKGLVKREIVRVITPGTVIEGCMLDESRNNYIASLYIDENKIGLCFSDISTGEISITELDYQPSMSNVICELSKFSPTEILVNSKISTCKGLYVYIKDKLRCAVDVLEDDIYSYEFTSFKIEFAFENDVVSLGFKDKKAAVLALGSLVYYIEKTQKSALSRLSDINFYTEDQFMLLDIVARANLELNETMRTSQKKGSLFWVLDETETAMGRRLLRNYIEKPLVNSATITKRLNAVDELYKNSVALDKIREALRTVYDLERIMTRVVCKTIAPRELRSLYDTLKTLPEIKALIEPFNCRYLKDIYNEIDSLEDIAELIDTAIDPEPSAALKDGNVINKGYNAVLDDFRDILQNVQDHLTRIEEREKERTGIKNLRTGYNRIFGYYIEITNSYKNLVPSDYIRKQTLTGAERYINSELKEIENKILDANDKVLALETELYNGVRDKVALELERIQKTASALSRLDVFCSMAYSATKNNYVCPTINANGVINIKDGRHPVVEKFSGGGLFIPNDTYLDRNDSVSLITGPNMAGKSTYMRQTALIVLMAHIGSFVPASSADITITDAIFTRVGASDDLSAGQSTFMVEMTELSDILKNATKDSLLILDEIGRGTSTYDGMSIARAALEYIADKDKLGAKCMFATHYHELAVLESEVPAIKNYNVAVKKQKEGIIFLRKIIKGYADQSYGIEVAKLANLPSKVISRAYEILENLESGKQPLPKIPTYSGEEPEFLQTKFNLNEYGGLISKLKDLSIDTISPIEALNILFELKKMVE
jgi:DNA mismatch repair protein MutS